MKKSSNDAMFRMPGEKKKSSRSKAFVRSTSTKYVRRRRRHINWGVVIAAVLFALVIGVSVLVILLRNDGGPVTDETVQTAGTTADVTSGETEPAGDFITVTVDNGTVHTGDVILVNYAHEYVFPQDQRLITVYGNKNQSYKVSNGSLSLRSDIVERLNAMLADFEAETGCHDVLVNSGYRSFEEQTELYDERVAKYGQAEAEEYVSKPGCSEHHTGMAIDFSIYTDEGKSYVFGKYEDAEWLRMHFAEYGFILRYPENKADITKVSFEGWHYRYVGRAHAMIMDYLELCLEEYVEYVKSYTADGKYLTLLSDGDVSYMYAGNEMKCECAVYYVPASDGGTTGIMIPAGMEYDISGNNADGFIVTVYGKAE